MGSRDVLTHHIIARHEPFYNLNRPGRHFGYSSREGARTLFVPVVAF